MRDEVRTASACRFWFGDSGDDAFLADLTGSVVGDVAVVYETVTPPRRIITPGQKFVGVKRTGEQLTMTVRMALRATAESRKLIDNPRGIWLLHRADDPAEVRMIPAICATLPIQSPDQGVIGFQATFTYDSTRFGTVAAPTVGKGAQVPVSGRQVAALLTANSIEYHEAAFNAPNDAVAVVGQRLIAEAGRRLLPSADAEDAA